HSSANQREWTNMFQSANPNRHEHRKQGLTPAKPFPTFLATKALGVGFAFSAVELAFIGETLTKAHFLNANLYGLLVIEDIVGGIARDLFGYTMEEIPTVANH
ncbi:hypothetical protein ACFL2H_01025, partial [Planctomycetota bacterium]